MTVRIRLHSTLKTSKWREVKVAQCPTLCDSTECTVPGILQARILEWVAIPFFRGSSQPRGWTQVSHIAGRLLTSWATREVLSQIHVIKVQAARKTSYSLIHSFAPSLKSTSLYCNKSHARHRVSSNADDHSLLQRVYLLGEASR